MDRNNIDKIAHTSEDRMLLAKLWDKIHSGMIRNIPANSGFLSTYEISMSRFLFGDVEGLFTFGGYEDSERKMLCYLPDYLDASALWDENSPIVCLRATYHASDELSHRDFLGALMGMGITRETIGDICVTHGSCDFFVAAEIAPYLKESFTSVGHVKVKVSQISLREASIPIPEMKEIRDTIASLRLDSIVATGFRIGRGLAVQHINAGKVSLDGQICEKPDKAVTEGSKISVRGLGKIKLSSINGQTKKGRISVIIHRYI